MLDDTQRIVSTEFIRKANERWDQIVAAKAIIREMAPRMRHYAQCQLDPNLAAAVDCDCGLIKWQSRVTALFDG